jgi:hypothetical protein
MSRAELIRFVLHDNEVNIPSGAAAAGLGAGVAILLWTAVNTNNTHRSLVWQRMEWLWMENPATVGLGAVFSATAH